MENKFLKYEKSYNAEDIENVFEILESELNLDPKLCSKNMNRNKNLNEHTNKRQAENSYETMPVKTMTSNYNNTIYLPNREINMESKKPNTVKINSEKRQFPSGLSINRAIQSYDKDVNNINRGNECRQHPEIPLVISNHVHDEKQYKMFKYAGHKF